MRRLGIVAAVAGLVAACAQPPPVRTETYAGADARGFDIQKVAIAPFRTSDSFQAVGDRDLPAREAALLVERFVSEALIARGVEVVSPGDVRTALRIDTPETALPPPAIVARVVSQEFGAPAVLYGTVYRMRERGGEAIGSATPASVWFEVSLMRAPGGGLLWKAVFNETQQPLGDNVLRARRYPGGGTRWLRAEELARWGARELAEGFPTSAAGSP